MPGKACKEVLGILWELAYGISSEILDHFLSSIRWNRLLPPSKIRKFFLFDAVKFTRVSFLLYSFRYRRNVDTKIEYNRIESIGLGGAQQLHFSPQIYFSRVIIIFISKFISFWNLLYLFSKQRLRNFVPFVKSIVERIDECGLESKNQSEKKDRRKEAKKLTSLGIISSKYQQQPAPLEIYVLFLVSRSPLSLSLFFFRAHPAASLVEDDEIGQAIDNDAGKIEKKRLLVVFGPGSKADVRTS